MNDKIQSVGSWLGKGSLNLFGRPFSGKDTQADILAALLNGKVIGGGEILRSQTDVPKDISQTYDSGDLAPSNFYLKEVTPYLSRPEYNSCPLILSSLGRMHGEEASILKAADDSHHPIKGVIYLKIDEDLVWERFRSAKQIKDRGQRADDTDEALKLRLEKFRTETLPVIEYYRNLGILHEIDGSLSVQAVTQEIIETLFHALV